ncbi:DNA ligase, putative [Babesia ovis]|uniref:DNA ligase, putative n=1 Tax=Babesia ovis TaxID=5869 RepID=A0A9W5WUH8_BABOV|nr:DNA ligase, putative [Babesia ovis]
MAKGVIGSSSGQNNFKGLGLGEEIAEKPLKRTEPISGSIEQLFSLGKRRPPPVLNTSDAPDQLKTPLLSGNFDVTNPDCIRENIEIFDLSNCICDKIDDLKHIGVFTNVKTVAILGTLAFSSRIHLTKLFTQSGIKVLSKPSTTSCIILGWWVDITVLTCGVNKNALVILEEDFWNLLDSNITKQCRHIKFQDLPNLLGQKQCGTGLLLKDMLRPTRIAHIAGHQDAFSVFHNFLLGLNTRKDVDEGRNKANNEDRTCIVVYPPGCGIRNGIELICRAMGFFCVYADHTASADKINIDTNLRRINVYHRENLDLPTLEHIVNQNKAVIIMVEDVECKFMAFRGPLHKCLMASRGTVCFNIPTWVKTYGLCITVPPTPELACRTLVKSILHSVIKEETIQDSDVEYFLENGRTVNFYVDLEKTINCIQFYKVPATTSAMTQVQFACNERRAMSSGLFTIGSYENSLHVVENAYHFKSNTHVIHDFGCDLLLRNVIKDETTTSEPAFQYDSTEMSTIDREMDKLWKNEKLMEKLSRRDHMDLLRMRKKITLTDFAPCENYNAPNFCLM